jgi:transcription antitermination factor NusG
MSYWACARVLPHRERLALHCLGLAGYQTYLPRIRERRTVGGRKVQVAAPLFPAYSFVLIELQWHAARWAPGVAALVMDGDRPARVPDAEIASLRAREHGGFITLPKAPKPSTGLHLGDRLRVRSGPFIGLDGLYAGMAPRDRIVVLLRILGAKREVALARSDVAAAP